MDCVPALAFFCALIAAVDIIYRFVEDCEFWRAASSASGFSLFARTCAATAWEALIVCIPYGIEAIVLPYITEPDVHDAYVELNWLPAVMLLAAWIITVICAVLTAMKRHQTQYH